MIATKTANEPSSVQPLPAERASKQQAARQPRASEHQRQRQSQEPGARARASARQPGNQGARPSTSGQPVSTRSAAASRRLPPVSLHPAISGQPIENATRSAIWPIRGDMINRRARSPPLSVGVKLLADLPPRQYRSHSITLPVRHRGRAAGLRSPTSRL